MIYRVFVYLNGTLVYGFVVVLGWEKFELVSENFEYVLVYSSLFTVGSVGVFVWLDTPIE